MVLLVNNIFERVSVLSQTNISRRYVSLDFAKFFCAFMIISIHVSYYGKIYFEPLSRIAVPIFFMITGYFYSSVVQSNRKYMQLRKTIELFIYSNLLYFIWNLLGCTASKGSVIAYLHSILNIKSWIKFLCFNESLFSEHLWRQHLYYALRYSGLS